MKDLLKPSRVLSEYLKPDGTLKRDCITCIHRNSKMNWGEYLCSGGLKLYWKCNPDSKNPIRLFWEPRVDVNAFLKEEDMRL